MSQSHVPHNHAAPGLPTGGICDDCALIWHKKPQLLSYCWWSWLGHSNACSWRYNYTKNSLPKQTPLCRAPKQINLYTHVLKCWKRRFNAASPLPIATLVTGPTATTLPSAGGLVAMGCPRLAGSPWAPATAVSQGLQVVRLNERWGSGSSFGCYFPNGRQMDIFLGLGWMPCQPYPSEAALLSSCLPFQKMLTWAKSVWLPILWVLMLEMGNLSTSSWGGRLSTEMHLCDANFPFV